MVSKKVILSLFTLLVFFIHPVKAQNTINGFSRQIEGLIHVAEVGTVVDTVNVWGSVGRTGRYVVPRDLNIPKLLSYAGGLSTGRNSSQQLEWVNNRITIKVNRYDPDSSIVKVASFESDYKEPLPVELFRYDLQNEDIITVQIERKANFWDYLRRASPIIGIVTSAIILYDRF